ncbi:acyltransferase [Kaistella flava (ex Peng et al. 2021)]|uniref:Acyltransferase n=1 Tax=Kaistella flava (ex Peng et al. 2021) TaxID=2038776 RepID=A0A7M2YA73_9FLAO|nr:acyltransferase family protein [Kaistella flava (ex Peng et al. 2021)]QOW11010.1 acyltransferase [Kaistella flava (ex Peng et al. 2021)]
MKRDLYIDFAKGFATLAIIFIHTVFWSGQFYVPTELRVLSLLIDVPLFFALSGLTSGANIEKTLYRLLKLQITYMIFVTFLFFLDYLFKVFGLTIFGLDWMKDFYSTFGTKYVPQSITDIPQWQNLGNWYLHQYTNADTFPVVMGSFWYLKVYFILTVFGVLILRFFPKHINWFIGLCLGLTLLFNVFPQYYPTGQVGYVALYLGIFLIAHQLKGKKIKTKWVPALYGILMLILIFLFWNSGKELFLKMNKAKFPPKLLYVFWASFSLLTLFVLYNRLKIEKNNLLTYIGQNAIFFYFAQGMSSSLIYFIVVPLKEYLPWGILVVLIFGINIFLAIIISEGLKKVDAFGWRIMEFLRKKTASV